MKNIKNTLSALTLLLLCAPAFAQNVKIGYLDYASIIYDMPEFKEYTDSLEKISIELDNKLETYKAEYMENAEKLEQLRNSPNPNNSLIELKEGNLIRIQQIYQKTMQDNQRILQMKEMELQKPLRAKLDKAIEEVSKEKGFTMVLDVNVVYFKRDSDDVEDLVRTKLKVISKAESEKKREELGNQGPGGQNPGGMMPGMGFD